MVKEKNLNILSISILERLESANIRTFYRMIALKVTSAVDPKIRHDSTNNMDFWALDVIQKFKREKTVLTEKS